MTKSILKLATCGILAMAFSYANAAVLASNVGTAVSENAVARQWVMDNLKVRAGASVQELEAAIQNPALKFTPEQQAAIAKMLNQFGSQYVSSKKPALVAKNATLADRVFKIEKNGQLAMATVADIVQSSASETRQGVNNVAGAASCPTTDVLAQTLADAHKNAKVSLADIRAAITSGTIVVGHCQHEVNGIRVDGALGVEDDQAFQNLIDMASLVQRNCAVGATGAALDKCWDDAEGQVLEIKDPAAQAANLAEVDKNCGGRGTVLRQAL